MSEVSQVKIMHKSKGVLVEGNLTRYKLNEISSKYPMVHFSPAIGEPGFCISEENWAWICRALKLFEFPSDSEKPTSEPK